MTQFSRDDLRMLTNKQQGVCVSIFVPTKTVGAEAQQSKIILKNLLKQAEKDLSSSGLKRSEIENLLSPIQPLINDTLFWQHQSTTLALFSCEGFFQSYSLPLEYSENVVVSNRFHFKPLLRLLSQGSYYYVLALSQKRVRLLQCTNQGVEQVEMADAPLSVDDFFLTEDYQKKLQFHTGAPDFAGGRAAVMHGQKEESEEIKNLIRHYFREIDKSLRKTIIDQEAPLLFAGVDYLYPIYREVTGYNNLLEDFIEGNPDNLRDEELRKYSWEKVMPVIRKKREKAEQRFYELQGTGKTSQDIKETVLASFHGRVETVFVATGVLKKGKVDIDNNEVYFDETEGLLNEDLLDYAALQTYINGGQVFPVKPENVPGNDLLATIFRY